jgi:alpha-tubulin suppressor-like RCC1 family protein
MFSDGWAGHAYAYRATNFIKKTDGKLYACGFGTDGNLGNGTFANSSSWVKVRIPENEEVIDMSWFQTRHGGFVILAVCKSGNMYIWGYNQDSGVIPLPGLINVSIPVKIPEFWK